jgi:hypothetical protein
MVSFKSQNDPELKTSCKNSKKINHKGVMKLSTSHRYGIGDIVFSEFEYNGMRCYHPVKIISHAGDDRFGKNYLVRSQDGEEYEMFENNLFEATGLTIRLEIYKHCFEKEK